MDGAIVQMVDLRVHAELQHKYEVEHGIVARLTETIADMARRCGEAEAKADGLQRRLADVMARCAKAEEKLERIAAKN